MGWDIEGIPELEPHIGSRRVIELFFWCGIAGNLVCLFQAPSLSIGASGAISGIMAYVVMQFPDARWIQDIAFGGQISTL